MHKTTTMKVQKDLQKNWLLVDAEGQTLGRLASGIAKILQGKNKPGYMPHQDAGDYVVVINAKKIVVSGNKLQNKTYYKHTGYKGHLQERTLINMLETKPEWVLEEAIKGMLPKNKLRDLWLKKLKVFASTEHEHQAQNPTPHTISL